MPTCEAFVLFCIYHFWFSLGSLDLEFFHYFLTVLTHYYFKYFFCSVVFLFSPWPSTNTYKTSLYCPTIFGCSLLLSFSFPFSLHFSLGIIKLIPSFNGWVEAKFLWYICFILSWLWASLNTLPQRESVICNSFSCSLLLLHWSPDHIVVYCKSQGTLYNYLGLDFHPLDGSVL